MAMEHIILSLFFSITLLSIYMLHRNQSKNKDAVLKIDLNLQHLSNEMKHTIDRIEGNIKQSSESISHQTQTIEQQFNKLREVINHQQTQNQQQLITALNDSKLQQEKSFATLREYLQQEQGKFRQNYDKYQIESLKKLQESLQNSSTHIRQLITETLNNNAKTIDNRLEKLTQENNQRLKEISGQVEKKLSEGFEKTTATFTDVVKRLAMIDAAQKKITELSTSVVSLQEILSDKRSRGAFGEVQLNGLIRNLMPESSFDFQASLSNGKRPDCLLYLPEPTGNVAIDAKFPLESFRIMTDLDTDETLRKAAEQQFRVDIRKHIQNIADKYIISGETSEGAVMFIPAEAVFAEIHSHYPDLIEFAHRQQVWLVSPTTMMAILTTARAVLKDAATRKQVHIIQEHLRFLSKDFGRFQKRMDNLEKHIDKAQVDVREVNQSAKKITTRFGRIEKVEITENDDSPQLVLEDA